MGGMACVLFLDLGTANVAPWWVTFLFLLLWLVLFAAGGALVRAPPEVGAVAAAGGFAVWLPTIVLGTRSSAGGLSPLSRLGSTRSTESCPSPLEVVTSRSPLGSLVTERSRPYLRSAAGVRMPM